MGRERVDEQPDRLDNNASWLTVRFAATAVVSAPVFANATGYVKGAGSIRKLSMFSKRLGKT